MSRTIADASRDYRNRRREKLERYETALKEISTMAYNGAVYTVPASVALDAILEATRNALNIET